MMKINKKRNTMTAMTVARPWKLGDETPSDVKCPWIVTLI
jgi:hypothetical protein